MSARRGNARPACMAALLFVVAVMLACSSAEDIVDDIKAILRSKTEKIEHFFGIGVKGQSTLPPTTLPISPMMTTPGAPTTSPPPTTNTPATITPTGSIFSSDTAFSPLTGLKSGILGRFAGSVVNASTGLPLGPFYIDIFGTYNASANLASVISFYAAFGNGSSTFYSDVPGKVIRTVATVTTGQDVSSLISSNPSTGRKLMQAPFGNSLEVIFGIFNCNNTVLGNKIQIGVGASYPVGFSSVIQLQPAGVYNYQNKVVSVLRGAIPIPTFDDQASFPPTVCGADTTTEVIRAFEVFLGCSTAVVTGVTCSAVKSLTAATNCRPVGNVQVYAFYDGLPDAYQQSFPDPFHPDMPEDDCPVVPDSQLSKCGAGALPIGDPVVCNGPVGSCNPPFVTATIDALEVPDVCTDPASAYPKFNFPDYPPGPNNQPYPGLAPPPADDLPPFPDPSCDDGGSDDSC